MSETNLAFFSDTANVWQVMYQECHQAEASIFFEQYILQDDACGSPFLRLFIEKARCGVKVHLILDRLGSRALYNSPLIKELRAAGGVVYFYNPIRVMNFFSLHPWFPRNHIKTAIIDSRVAFVGSACHAEYMRSWHDIQARVTGPLVQGIESDFLSIFRKLERGLIHPVSEPEAPHQEDIRYVATQPGVRVSPIYKELLLNIRNARSRVYLVTPYFLPPLRLRVALRDAVLRGVDVKVMMGQKTDAPLADYVAHSYFPRLLEKGIGIFLYQKPVLHAKYTVIDDSWATLGSTNMDYLSLLMNREANLVIQRQSLIEQLGDLFLSDIQHCLEASPDYCRNIPWRYKAIGFLGRSVKKIL